MGIKDKLKTLKDGTYRLICSDGQDEQFASKQEMIERLAHLSKYYDMINDIEALVSFEHGWYALDNGQVESDVESFKFEQNQEAISERRHEAFESASIRSL